MSDLTLKEYEQYIKNCKFNTIYVLESRRSGDAKNGANLAQWLKYRTLQQGIGVEYHEINSKKALIKVLNQIRNKVNEGYLPFIHFEMHGSPKGLLAGKDIVEWKGVVNLLRTINVPTGNNLIVTFAVCNAFFIYPEIDIFKKSPFFGFIGNVNEIPFGESEEDFHEFFDELLDSFNFEKALGKLNQNHEDASVKYNFRFSLSLFEDVWYYYNKVNSDPSVKNKRVIDIMSMALSNISIRHRFTLPELRYEIEKMLSVDGLKERKSELLKSFMDMS